MIKVSIIVPTYNEAKNLPLLVKEVFAVIDRKKVDLEFIVVDDNSPDQSGEVAEELAKKYPLKVIHRAKKMGLGSAVQDGFKFSAREYLGVMDGDLSHDPKILNELILSLTDHDIAIGSRFAVENSVHQWNRRRRFIAYSGAWLARRLTGVKDPLSGYFFFRRKVIANIKLKTVGYKILLEILVKGKYHKIEELPYTFRMRKYSTSKLNSAEFLLFLKQIASLSLYKIVRRIFNYG